MYHNVGFKLTHVQKSILRRFSTDAKQGLYSKLMA